METHEKIRLIRELNKWSQEEMAEKLAMSAGGYAKIERGETQLNIPRLEQLNQELKHCREMLEQKDKEIELLKQLAASMQK